MTYGEKIVREKEKNANEGRRFCDMWATATSHEL